MELEQVSNEPKYTPTTTQKVVRHESMPTNAHKPFDLVRVLGKAWHLFNRAALRVFLMMGLVLMIQIMHQAHGQLYITIPISFVGVSVLIGELVNLYNEIDVIWMEMK